MLLPPDDMEEGLWTPAEVAAYLGVPRHTLAKLDIPVIHAGPRRRLYIPALVREWRPQPRQRKRESDYWSRLALVGSCWEWTGSKQTWGYGVIHVKGKPVLVHRYAYRRFIGPIPQGQLVLHRCDNPPCVRLDHLFVGTASDNMRDRYGKKREGLHGGAAAVRARLVKYGGYPYA